MVRKVGTCQCGNSPSTALRKGWKMYCCKSFLPASLMRCGAAVSAGMGGGGGGGTCGLWSPWQAYRQAANMAAAVGCFVPTVQTCLQVEKHCLSRRFQKGSLMCRQVFQHWSRLCWHQVALNLTMPAECLPVLLCVVAHLRMQQV